jgi:hypothetical protein
MTVGRASLPPWAVLLAILAPAPIAAQGAQPPPLARTSAIPAPDGYKIEEVLSCDLSGDDVADACVASKGSARHRLQIHVRRTGPAAYSGTPDATLDLTPDVIAFAAADVLPDEGREVLLFNPGGVFAWRWREKDETKRIVRLLDADLLWQLPGVGSLFHLQSAVVDLDGDGREDLCIPEPQGLRVAFQLPPGDGPRFKPAIRLFVAEDDLAAGGPQGKRVVMRTPGGRRSVSIDLGGDFNLRGEGQRAPPYLSLDETAPAAELIDWDGDGDRDVLALSDAALHVFVQEPRGAVDAARELRLPSPVPRDRRRELDVSYQVRALDLDKDGRSDLVIFALDQRADSPRTQVLVFRQASQPAGEPLLFGAAGKPTELLVLDGFARPIAIRDVDGDGLPDLVAAALRPNLIDALRAAASERIDTELYVFRNRGAQGFSKRPDLTRVLSLQASGGDNGGQNPFLAEFAGDITGDGVSELFLRTDRDRLGAYMVRRGKDGALTVVDKPLWELAISPSARVLMPGVILERTPDLFVIDPGGVVCASFR